MNWYTGISGLCVVVLTVGASYVLSKLINKDRRERVEFVRSFKNGRCVFILLPTIVIVFLGLYYQKTGVKAFFQDIFKAIPTGMKFVVLDFGLNELEPLMSANICYAIAVYLDCVLIVFNVCMVALSIFKQRVHCTKTNWNFCKTKADVVLVAGRPTENRLIYASAPSDAKAFLYCPLSKEEQNNLYNEGVEFLTLHESKLLQKVCNTVKANAQTGVLNIFINTGDDSQNIALANHLILKVKEIESVSSVTYDKLAVYTFGNSNKKNLFLELEEKGFGCFHYVDEYKLATLDLIEKHPMASFFNENQVDFKTAIVKDVELRVFLIGFGKTNTELFLQSVSNDQYVTLDEKGLPVHKAVKYYLFDRKKILENSNLNYSYNRYSAFRSKLEHDGLWSQYWDIAPVAAKEHLIPMQDIDSKTFFHNLHENLAKGEHDINLISVSLGCDIDSVDIANKIQSKCKEWGLYNTQVSVRIRDRKEATNIANKDLLLWGDLRESVFNYSTISRKKLEKMAMIHDGIYNKYKEEGREASLMKRTFSFEDMAYKRKWFKEKDRIKRESSFNVCLNIKTKLCLMGFGARLQKSSKLPLTAKDIRQAVGKPEESGQLRENLARQEHYRWNAHYICSGYIPASIDEAKNCEANGKSSELRRHPNLLEFDALRNYEEATGNKVVKYDEQAIDELASMYEIYTSIS